MENIDIFDENNDPTGKRKEKQQANEDTNYINGAVIKADGGM